MVKQSAWSQWFTIYVVPGLIFQSVIVGGGYGTGREITEFFLLHGPYAGLFGMLVAALVWGVVLAIAFEFARITRSYHYQAFFKALLGRFAWLFEVIYLLIAVIVLAVLGSASGEILQELLGIPSFYGVLLLMVLVALLTFWGSKAIERIFVFWSGFLFLTFVLLLLVTWSNHGEVILAQFSERQLDAPWLTDGVRYAAYNLNALAAVLFVVPRFKRARHAVGAGLLAGAITIVPGMLVFLALLANYPAVLSAAVPVMDILALQNVLWLLVMLKVMLFGTFIETGSGVIHAINERLAARALQRGRTFERYWRAIIAFVMVFFATVLAEEIGIIDLIKQGYGWLSYGYLVVVVIPLLTLGTAMVIKHRGRAPLND
jgi:uncharacterized membrane protein YkvI